MPSPSRVTVMRQARKRPRSDGDFLERPHKSRRTSPRTPHRYSHLPIDGACEGLRNTARHLNRRPDDCAHSAADAEADQRRARQGTQYPAHSSPVYDWVLNLPKDFESLPERVEGVAGLDTMSRAPAAKRTRSSSSASEHSLLSDGEDNTTVSRELKGSIYKDPRYPVVMESKGSFMREAEHPLSLEERGLIERLKNTPLPHDPMLDPAHLCQLRELLRNRSELRVCIELHPHLVPPAEILALRYPDMIKNLAEGHNDRWLDNFVFYKQLPQPDRTVAFSLAAFTETERQQLQVVAGMVSPFVACRGTLFPFFTAEVKCGKEALDVADSANINSMTVALRAVVELYRRAGEVTTVHRKTLGFSISHDDGAVRIYGHYPEIDGEKISYHRTAIRDFSYADNNAQERETAYRFVWNLFTIFAPDHLKRLKQAIGRLRDPLSPPAGTQPSSHDAATSEDNVAPLTPSVSNSGPMFAKPGLPQRHNSATVSQQVERQRKELLAQFEQLQKTAKQQQQDAKEREDRLMAQLERLQQTAKQQQQDAKEREEKLQKEAKQREEKLQKEAKEREDNLQIQLRQQQKDAREQHTQLVEMLTQQTAFTQDTQKTK